MILVTGASGTAGAKVVEALGPVALLRATRMRQPKAGERRFDYADPATWRPAFEGVEAVFLMLPPGLPGAKERFRMLLRKASSAGVTRVVFLSIRNADRLGFLPHRGIEQEIERCGLGWTHLRPNDWMQNFVTQPLYRGDIEGGGLWAPNGSSRSSYVDVRDVAAVAAIVLQGGHEGRAYPLTGPEDLALGEVAECLSRALGRLVINHQPSLPRFILHALRRGTPPALAAVMASIGLVARLGLARGIDQHLEALLGRRPTSFSTFAADYAHLWGGPPSACRQAGAST